MGIIYFTDIYPRKTESTHVINTTFFRVLVFPLQQNGEITDWSKCCLWQNKLFKWLITQMLKDKCRLSEGCIQLNRLLKHLSERIDILRRRVAQEPGGVGAFHELLLNNRNLCLVSLAGLFFLLSQEPFTEPFPWPNFFKMPLSLEEFHAVFPKIHVCLGNFLPFFNLSRKYFS